MSGLKAVLEQVAGERPDDADEQSDLFDDPALPMPVQPVATGAGRPKGRRNRSTEEWRRVLLAKHASPLEFLLSMCARTPRALAEELGLYENIPVGGGLYEQRLATGEAFKRQIEAAVAVLPYLHQKQPMAVEVTGEKRGLVVLGDLNVAGGAGDFALPIMSEENQQVIEHDDEQEKQRSQDVQSHESANALRFHDENE